MDINSIIDNIKTGLASSYEGKIEIKESSFMLNLLEEGSTNQLSKTPFAINKPWENFRHYRFPITVFILRCIVYLIEIIISSFYYIARKLRCFLLGKSADKDLSVSPRFNFIIFITAITAYIVAIVFLFIFFIKSVLLFNPNNSVNDQGAIEIPQPCGIEHYLYLFNASECWANTGIKVLKGDIIHISASGSFYSKISHMDECAKMNEKAPYHRNIISSDLEPANGPIRPLLIYKGEDAKFGSLLLHIKEDYEEPLYDSSEKSRNPIKQLKFIPKKGFETITVDSSGVLNFAVNDIYFTNKVLGIIKKDSILQEKLEIETIKIGDNTICTDSLKSPYHGVQRNMWFYDNVGEILLSIEIMRNNMSVSETMPSKFVKIYRSMEKNLRPLSLLGIIGLLLSILLAIYLWLLLDYRIGLYLKKKQ